VTIVVDASAVVAALIDGGALGEWAAAQLAEQDLAAPHLMPVEAANTLRRGMLAGLISEDRAGLAHERLLQLSVVLYPYESQAGRVWQLRGNLTAYDASYVALAETLDAPLVTLDGRVARATGPRCAFRLPPQAGPTPATPVTEQ
jgi:predicted nucleic acid-binding protein